MKRNAPQSILLVLLFFLATAASAVAAVDMREGEWEVVSETSMAMGGMSMPGMTHKVTHCLTRDDPVPTSENEKECKIEKVKISGNTVSWKMICKDGEGEGEITYRGTSYKGTFRMTMAGDGDAPKKTGKARARSKKKAVDDDAAGEGPMTMTMKLSGKYLGPCPKGQRSGPTGETAKQLARHQAMAQEAQAQGKKAQEEMEAQQRKAEAFMKKAVVPAEESGACPQAGFQWSDRCEQRVGKLNLQDGEYEITIEEATRTSPPGGRPFSVLDKPTVRSVSLGENRIFPDEFLTNHKPRTVKRGKDRITWVITEGDSETRGGINYRGTSFEGVVTTKTSSPNGVEVLLVRKFTGKRIGDPKQPVGRSYSAQRGYSAKPKSEILPDNPLKSIRRRLGF